MTAARRWLPASLDMLILSRRIGESVVINRTVVATVAVVGAEFVDPGLSQVDGGRLGTVTLSTERWQPIREGARAILVKAQGDWVRLGFEYPEGVRIMRAEWDRA